MAEKRFIDGIGARLVALVVFGLSSWGLYEMYQNPGSGAIAAISSGGNDEAFTACIAKRGQVFDELLAMGQMTKEQVVTAKARLAPVCRIESKAQN